MKRKGKESKLNVVLTALLVVFVCLLSFSVGVISGKGWSDRDYRVKFIEQDSNVKEAMNDESEALGDEISEKEVELLTQKALAEAKAIDPNLEVMKKNLASVSQNVPTTALSEEEISLSADEKMALNNLAEQNLGLKKSNVQKSKKIIQQREVSSLPPQPTIPTPAQIEYTVQVAAYKTINEAENHSQKLIDKGFPAFPVKALIDGQEWYRVSIGSFKNKSQALNYEKSLKKQSMVKSTFVQKITRSLEQ